MDFLGFDVLSRIRWTLPPVVSAVWTPMELAKICKFQLPVNAARVSHFLDAETCRFSQVPSLSSVHGCPWDIKVGPTLIPLLLITILGQASLDDK